MEDHRKRARWSAWVICRNSVKWLTKLKLLLLKTWASRTIRRYSKNVKSKRITSHPKNSLISKQNYKVWDYQQIVMKRAQPSKSQTYQPLKHKRRKKENLLGKSCHFAFLPIKDMTMTLEHTTSVSKNSNNGRKLTSLPKSNLFQNHQDLLWISNRWCLVSRCINNQINPRQACLKIWGISILTLILCRRSQKLHKHRQPK